MPKQLRKISAEELANLLNNWNNTTVDTSKYYQSVLYAFEVTKNIYEEYKKQGGLCQTHKEKYYIA